MHQLINTTTTSFANYDYISAVMDQWFDVKDKSTQEWPRHSAVIVGMYKQPQKKIIDHLHSGGKCIIDGVWECHTNIPEIYKQFPEQVILLTSSSRPRVHPLKTISVPRWFWYNESLWYRHRGYHTYQPSGDKNKKFFMPVRRSAPERDVLFDKLTSQLDHAIWSYVGRGIRLPDYSKNLEDQRYFNPAWYDQTWFSMVVETYMTHDYPVFLTEKTYKPMAYRHPFLLAGQAHSLKEIRSMGFETYPEVFDESYDDITDSTARMDFLVRQIKEFDSERLADPRVQQKIQHNHNHFFDRDLVIQGIQDDLVRPLLDFLDGK